MIYPIDEPQEVSLTGIDPENDAEVEEVRWMVAFATVAWVVLLVVGVYAFRSYAP